MRSGMIYQAEPHRYGLQVDTGHRGNMHRVQSHMHYLQTDNNVAPMMGRVHFVKPSRGSADNHIMKDMHGDINEGHRLMVEKSKRGPFQNKSGRSTIRDSTKHTMYRSRRGNFEITIKRGITASELRRLASKLNVHSLSQQGSRLVIIKGGKRYVLGYLRDLNVQRILSMVEDCADQYGVCGLEITEEVRGTGALHSKDSHSRQFHIQSHFGRGSIHE